MEFKDTVIFTDWFDVNQIPNNIDPRMSVSATGVYDEQTHELDGYILTVIWNSFPLQPRILYRVHVEDARDNIWSLTSEEAVKFLNKIGFICEFTHKGSPLSQKVIDTLKALSTFGYTHICRNSDANSQFYVGAWLSGTPESEYQLNSIPNYDYEDWLFLPLGDPQLISGLLESRENSE